MCKLRKSLLGGAKVRCGWDVANKKCSLFVGDNLKHQAQGQRKGPLRQRKSMIKDCTVRVAAAAAQPQPQPNPDPDPNPNPNNPTQKPDPNPHHPTPRALPSPP